MIHSTALLLTLSTALLTLSASEHRVSGHSWIHCTQYQGDVSIYDESACVSWPRGATTFNGDIRQSPFGTQKGFDTKNTVCQGNVQGGASSRSNVAAEIAQYTQGQVVCIAWPSNNHGNAGPITNLPDTLNAVQYGPVGEALPSEATFSANQLPK